MVNRRSLKKGGRAEKELSQEVLSVGHWLQQGPQGMLGKNCTTDLVSLCGKGTGLLSPAPVSHQLGEDRM